MQSLYIFTPLTARGVAKTRSQRLPQNSLEGGIRKTICPLWSCAFRLAAWEELVAGQLAGVVRLDRSC